MYVGQVVTVEGPVACTGYGSDGIGYINLGLCYPDPGRLTIAIPLANQSVFTDALGQDPLDAVAESTIQVTGTIELYLGNEPIIWLRDPGNLAHLGKPGGSTEALPVDPGSATTTTDPSGGSTMLDSRIPIIIDDDGSPDGVLALLYFLAHPNYRVVAATVSVGIARPVEFAPNLTRLLTLLGRTDVIVAAGREYPLSGDNSFPNPWRDGAANFWGLDLPSSEVAVDRRSAADVIVDIVDKSAQPVVLFVSGAHTNLAEALRLNPSIVENIDHISIMGGAVYVSGNIHHDWPTYPYEAAEWNIWVDPIAFGEVLASGMELRMAPLDATNLVPWQDPHLDDLRRASSELAEMAYELFKIMLPLQYVWDLVAGAVLEDTACCTLVSRCINVETRRILEEGKTSACSGEANVLLCLDPAALTVRRNILDTLIRY